MQPPDRQLHHFLQRLNPFPAPGTPGKTGDTQGADATKNASPIAWQNVNLHGRYEFLKQVAPLNVDIIIQKLTEIPMNLDMAPAA